MFKREKKIGFIAVFTLVFLISVQMIAVAGESWALLPFVKQDNVNPILKPKADTTYKDPLTGKTIHWESGHIYNPTALIKDNEVYLLYRAQSNSTPPSPSVVGIAKSSDGINFERLSSDPVLYPEYDYEKYGCEDPRVVVLPNGKYLLMYTGYDGKTARLCSALSDDLYNWKKLGPVFKGDKFKYLWSKSGALITEYKDKNFTALTVQFQILGSKKENHTKFGMFWGDTDIFFATATMEQLKRGEWSPVLAENGFPKPVITPRAGLFDSRLCESGPAAMNDNGKTLLLYNGMNLKKDKFGFCDKLTDDEYTSGQVQVDTENPFNVKNRLNKPFMRVTKDYEKKGLVDNVVFIEGLVKFNNKYYLYYGCGDSLLAVAVCKESMSLN